MSKTEVIGFLGCGNLAECILSGLLRSHAFLPKQIYVCNRTESKMQHLHEKYGVLFGSAELLLEKCDIIYVGVKPWAVADLMDNIAPLLKSTTILVSLAAGIAIGTIMKHLGDGPFKVLRAMPNLPCFVGEGTISITGNDKTSPEDIQRIATMFESVGKVFIVEESAIHSVIGAAGSAPAYVFMFIEALSDAAVHGGIPRSQAYEMVAQTVLGSVKMMMELKKSPSELKDMVCTPGGTTIEALRQLEKGGLRSTLMEGAIACMRKSKDMEESSKDS